MSHKQCIARERYMDRDASDVHLTKMCSVMSIRCLSKIPPSSLTSTGSQIATWRRSLTWTSRKFGCNLLPPSTGKMFFWDHRRFCTNPVQCDILPNRHSQLSDLTIRLNYTTTSLKSVSQKRWLYHQMFKLSSEQFNSQVANHMTSHSSFSLVSRLTADVFCYDDHKYINIHRHQLFIFSEINNGWSMTATVL